MAQATGSSSAKGEGELTNKKKGETVQIKEEQKKRKHIRNESKGFVFKRNWEIHYSKEVKSCVAHCRSATGRSREQKKPSEISDMKGKV